MPTVVTNPLGELLGGMVQGYGLAHQIKQQAMQQEAHDRAMAEADRRAQVEDIQTRMMLDQNARPVSAGTVTQPGNSAPLNVAGIDLGSIKAPDLVRPVDKSRKVTYKGRDGQAQDYELLTPEEQTAKAVAKATSMKHAGSTLINTPEHLQKLGLPAQMYVPDEHLYQYAATTGELQPVDTPQAYQEMGGTSQVPVKNIGSVMTTIGQKMNRDAQDRRAADANKTRAQIAEENRKSADQRASEANKTRAQIAAGRNATTLQAASIRADSTGKTRTLTPNEKLKESERLRGQIRRYESLIGLDNGEDFIDPDAKGNAGARKMNSIWRTRYAQLKSDAETRLKGLGANAPQAGPDGKIRVQIGEHVGWIDPGDFDAKTMQKLDQE